MYIFRWPYVHFQMLDEENKLIFGSRIVTMYD